MANPFAFPQPAPQWSQGAPEPWQPSPFPQQPAPQWSQGAPEPWQPFAFPQPAPQWSQGAPEPWKPFALPQPVPQWSQGAPEPWKLVAMNESGGYCHTPAPQNYYNEHRDSKSSLEGNGFNRPESSDSDSRVNMDREERFKNTLKRFVSQLPFCANSLQRQISELEAVAASLDKTRKGTRIARITGGTTGAVGGVAAVAGILLAPATMGASLAVTALGVAAATAGGVTGASAAITNKVKTNQVRKKLESILKEYQSETTNIEVYLNDINSEMEKLKGVRVKSAQIVRLVEIAGGTSGALSVINKSSGAIQGFALGMDLFFTDKNSQKLKKESKSKFAQQICEVAGQIQAGLTELLDMRDKLQKEGI
ncbi:apolipoprotein L6-like [Siphateles boraxobius]|uniref:apolipoprotein L6-like n=1 Tax=Siphateles boraxobius TaxID=180520 RepID=UPI0040648A6C